ncbi:MAG: thioredoxin family protein [Bacteroidales bacterium]|nr:thioredoxin family protein [Bacteroidales bacterium]
MDLSALQQKIAGNSAILLYFFNDHCAPCLSLRPKVQDLIENDFSKIDLLFVNSEKYPGLTAHYSVFSNPTLIMFFEGKEFQRWSKFVSVSQIASAIEKPYSLLFDNENQ